MNPRRKYMKPLRWLTVAGLMSTTLTTLVPLRADTNADNDPDSIAALRAQIEALDQKVRVLQRKDEISQDETATKLKSFPTVTVDDKGLTAESADKAYKIRLDGFIQTQYRTFIGDNKVNDGFDFRRIRPTVSGTLDNNLDYLLVPELSWSNGTNKVRIIDAYGDFRLISDDSLRFRFGAFRTPLGIEQLQSATNLTFAERGLATDLVPIRDLGAELHGDLLKGELSYAVGAFNGALDQNDASSNFNDGKGLDLDAGLFAQPFKNSGPEALRKLEFGVAGGYGSGSAGANSDQVTYKSFGQNTFFGTDTTDYSFSGGHYRFNPQLYYYNGPWGFLGEYVYEHTGYVRNGTNTNVALNSQAWTGHLSYVLTGEDASYNGVKPAHPVGHGGAGAWEIAGQFGDLSVDGDAFTPNAGHSLASSGSASNALEWGFGVNWYLTNNFKFQTDFTQTAYNGNANGRGGQTGDLPTENAVVSELQIAF
jgi:phosphate-selective porin OprO/OprP